MVLHILCSGGDWIAGGEPWLPQDFLAQLGNKIGFIICRESLLLNLINIRELIQGRGKSYHRVDRHS